LNNQFYQRKLIITIGIIAIAVIYVLKLFYIQVIDKQYIVSANSNVLRKIIQYPARGIIYDRNHKILVQNEPVYDLLVIPNQIQSLDTNSLCTLIGLSKPEFIDRLNKIKAYSMVKSSIIEKQISAETYATFQEKLFEFKGFYIQNRTVRHYPEPIASHILGYIGEVDERIIKRSGSYYKMGDYIGISGIERAYEESLRGRRGVRNILVDVFNREKGSYENGKFDTLAVAGDKLICSLDLDLQKYGEQLMQNKKGSIVAIEPKTGEILAYISSPNYDPNLLVGRGRSMNYRKLLLDEDKPLFNRPIQAEYPPGSIFKIVQALVGQQLGVLEPSTVFPCGGGYRVGRLVVKCTHVHPPLNLVESIQHSCNAYYCNAFRRMIDQGPFEDPQEGFAQWKTNVLSFGLGNPLRIDLPNENDGLIPKKERYDKIYGKNRWKSSTIISLSIGQGELGITPMQMANLMAIVANKGYYFTPHLIKGIGEKEIVKPEFAKRNTTSIKPEYFEPVIEGMEKVVSNGTAYWSRIPEINMCGKTGTVQNPHGEDHSVFVAFAPKENPKIAIAVVVENAGFGAVWAAPIASLMVEKYLKGKVTRPAYYEDRIVKANLMNPKPVKVKKNVE
jgi:penicillin-binding protein 2